jgi:flagellar hook assembly protein FlgD
VDVPEPSGGPQTAGTGKPLETSLLQITPSLFSLTTEISYQITGNPNQVSLKVYDVSGRLVRVLVNSPTSNLEPGTYQLLWDGRDDQGKALPSGVYFLRLETDASRLTRKAVLTR